MVAVCDEGGESMKARPIKSRNNYITAYNLTIGCKEAREAGFVTEDGERMELKKTIDAKNRRIIIEVDDSQTETNESQEAD